MTRDEAQAWFVQVLLDKVREDRYPSATHLALVEQSIPRAMVPDYREVLIDKVDQDKRPSIAMRRRIQRVAQTLPRTEKGRG